MRINKFIAASTKLSRRKADDAILKGRVTVNGNPLTDFAYSVSEQDEVALDGTVINPITYVYYALNKPPGVVATTSDPHAHHIVTDLVPNNPPVFPVGRLDKDSRGLIFLTNDGDFTQRLTHPSFEHEKEYIVTTKEQIRTDVVDTLLRGVRLAEGVAVADNATQESEYVLRMTLHQGWNRQIRRMLKSVGYEVTDLFRIRIANFDIGDLHEGMYIPFEPELIITS